MCMKKRQIINAFLLLFIVLYVIGSVPYTIADEGSGRRNGNSGSGSGNGGDDGDDDSDSGEDDDSDDSSGSGRDVFRIRERIRVVGEDGIEREIRFEYREREDGRIEQIIKIKVRDEEVEVELEDEIEVEDEVGDDSSNRNRTRLRVKLRDGTNASIKIMPDVAAARALEALRLHACSPENNCTIVLKDVGRDRDDDDANDEAEDDSADEVEDDEIDDSGRLRYEIRAEKRFRVFGLFEKRAEVRAEIDADDGVIDIDKPWWSAFSSEVEEVPAVSADAAVQ